MGVWGFGVVLRLRLLGPGDGVRAGLKGCAAEWPGRQAGSMVAGARIVRSATPRTYPGCPLQQNEDVVFVLPGGVHGDDAIMAEA